MTTIATDGKTIAADSQLSGDYIEQIDAEKIFRINGELVGIAGSVAVALRYVEWLRAGGHPSDRPKLSDKFEAIHVTKSGVYWVDNEYTRIKCGKTAAIGSGARFAMGALLAGASPQKAIVIASKLDPNTGGKITSMGLK